MFSKRGWLACFAIPCFFVLLITATISPAQVSYTTTWVANSYATAPTYVGNAMRSMWVAPEGVIYTSSDWDESQGGINFYQNGQKLGTMGGHGETMGGAMSGDATDLFAALQFNTSLGGSGYIGRYNRSTGTRDLTWSASTDTTERLADVITGITDTGTLIYVSDHPDSLVRCYTTAGVWQSDWSLMDPGAIALDGSGNIWVAQKNEGTIQECSPSGSMLNTVNMGSSSRPSALYFDSANNQLMVGNQGPNMNIQIYGNLSSAPALVSSFGVQGGYLDTTTGNKGQTGSQRFTRVVGIGKDSTGNLYVLNNPWGGTWDLGRNGKTDLHAYSSSFVLQYMLQGLNFEGDAAFDPGTDGAYLYSGQDVYTGSGGAGYVGNSVDSLDYPTDPRVDMTNNSRGFDFGIMTSVNGHRILASTGQNPDIFLFSYFPINQYASIPFGTLPGQTTPAGYTNYFNTLARVRNGFCLDTNGDIVGNDVDSMYGIRAYQASNGDYLVSKDNYNNNSIIIHRMTVGPPTPDFSVSATPSSQTAAQGSNTTYTTTISPLNGFTDTVSLNVSGLPAGATASFIPASAVNPRTWALMVSTATTTAAGTYTLTITGTSGSLSHSTTVTLVVATPNFSISATPGSQTVVSGNNATYTASISPLLGFTDTVNLSVSELPTGATANFNPTSVAGSGNSPLTVSTATTTPTGTYTLTITGNSGGLSHSTTVTLVVSTTSGGLPAGWTDQDVGSVALAGSASYSNGTFTVNGAGSSISGTADQFNYAYQAAGTSYTITTRIVSMTNTNTGAQAGVMIRETLDAGSTMANINVTPANGVTWVYRTATNGTATGSRTSGLVAPYWARVVRSGSTFTGYFSPDGVTWTQQGTVSISIASNGYIGLVVSSRNSSELSTAVFDNVSVTTP